MKVESKRHSRTVFGAAQDITGTTEGASGATDDAFGATDDAFGATHDASGATHDVSGATHDTSITAAPSQNTNHVTSNSTQASSSLRQGIVGAAVSGFCPDHNRASDSEILESPELTELIDRALAEDIAGGDITGEAIIPESSIATASLVLKEPAVIAGLQVFESVLKRCDSQLFFEVLFADADEICQTPCCLARMKGRSRALLAAERTALNLIQRMCGIASLTRKFVELASPFGIEILDTRKTTPGLRLLEKWAVKLGGGTNHRFGLYDQILIKDNHLVIAGGVAPAVELARKHNANAAVEVEVNSLDQLQEALDLNCERVMLDNMSPVQVRQAVTLAAGRTYIEVSGGIDLSNLNEYLITGVNGISVGALTHSVKNIDISLEFEELSHAQH